MCKGQPACCVHMLRRADKSGGMEAQRVIHLPLHSLPRRLGTRAREPASEAGAATPLTHVIRQKEIRRRTRVPRTHISRDKRTTSERDTRERKMSKGHAMCWTCVQLNSTADPLSSSPEYPHPSSSSSSLLPCCCLRRLASAARLLPALR